MQFSEEWKQLWTISSVFSPPLLISNTTTAAAAAAVTPAANPIGPLIFNPSTKTALLQLIFSSSSSVFPTFPSLSLPRFLSTTNSSSSSLLPSTASSIANGFIVGELSSSYNGDKLKLFSNSLQLLRCPRCPVIYAFFPAGDNLEKIGFLVISVKDSNFEVKSNNGYPFFVKNSKENHHRILKLLVNPVDDFVDSYDCFENTYVTVGYMLAFSNYSIYWYNVKVHSCLDVSSGSCPVVEFVGFKCFRSSGIVHACWSPHLVEESVVLLENGELFLFDLGSCSKNKKPEGKRLRVSWNSVGDGVKNLQSDEGGWLSCEFSWHPRILIVAHSSAVFLLDMRLGRCEVSCLLTIEMFSATKNDDFVTLSKSGADGFCFVVASKQLLLLCDVRKPMMTLLRWWHGLDNVNYVTVLKLSELRSNSKEDMYKWASESGYCILLGSFWDCEFSLFCYGPNNSKMVGLSKMPKVCNFCAWGLPSDISLSGRSCVCGTCLVREEFSKEALPRWTDWRQKKDLVLGFGIVDTDLSSQFFDADSFGGFSLVRLMSSGKLEVQRYHAAWEFEHHSEVAHRESVVGSEDNPLYDSGEVKYDLQKRHHFLALDNLREYLRGNVVDASIDSGPEHHDGHAVSLADDADNLSDGAEKMEYSPSQKTIPPDDNLSGVNLMRRVSIPEKKEYRPLTPERSQDPMSKVKHEVVGLAIFDEGCPIDLKFNDPPIDFGSKELKMYKWLRAQDLKFQKGFKLY